MLKNKIVSIVVPIFNVEMYLDDCIKCLIRQSYSNLEIILVDDGSTDKSYQICKNYSKIDSRIKLYHKNNGGLSDARNYGISKAHGEYITFVDSDDVIVNDYVKILVESLENNNCDFCVCEIESFVNGENVELDSKDVYSIEVMNKVSAYKEMLLERKISVSACGKLFKTDLFKNIRFPYGLLYEDLATTYKIVELCNAVCYVNCSLYKYRRRSNSITTSSFSLKKMDIFHAFSGFKKHIYQNYKELIFYADYRECDCAIAILGSIDKNNQFYKKITKKMKLIIKTHIFSIIKSKDIKLQAKVKMILAILNLDLFHYILKKYNNCKGKEIKRVII